MDGEIRISKLFGVVAAAVTMAATAAADTVVHVTGATYGCVKPKVALLLTNPDGADRADNARLARTIADGQCVVITPRSPWRPVSNDAGGETLLEYRGTTARPGTFWVPTSIIAYPVQDSEAGPPLRPAITPTITLPAKVIVPPKPAPAAMPPKRAPGRSVPSATMKPPAAVPSLTADAGAAGDTAAPVAPAQTADGTGSGEGGAWVWLLVGVVVLGAIAGGKRRRSKRSIAHRKRSQATASEPNIHVSSTTQRNRARLADDAQSAPINILKTPQVNRSAPAEPAAATATIAVSSARPSSPVRDQANAFEPPRINIGSLWQVNDGPNPAIVPVRTAVPAGKRSGKVSSAPIWHPPGSAVTVVGHVIADGMIYVGKSGRHGPEGAGCVVDLSLPVGSADKATALGYWPSYGDITAACRGVYLRWLADGRRRPETDIGYVFLFFYGIERRLLVDQPAAHETSALIAEIHRLRSIYGANNSFEGYSRRLIEAATALAMRDAEFIPALDAPAGIFPMPLAVAIGRKVAAGQKLGFELAAAGLLGLPWERGLQDNLVLKAVRPQFLEVLRPRFENRYPGGFLPSGSAPEPLSPHYHPAAASLQIDLAAAIGRLPDPSQLDWSELVEFARQVAQEIAPFYKLLAYHPERTETLAAAASCPPELARNVGTAARQWLESLPRPIAAVTFGELAMRAIGKSQQKWTIREHREIRDALMAFHCRIEPDPDDGFERLDSATPVIVLKSPSPAAPNSPRFKAAAAATHLVAGYAASSAHGTAAVEEPWLLQVRERLALRDEEVLRLRAKLAWLRGSSAGLAKAARLLADAGPEDRALAAWSATVAAVACGAPDNARIATLEAVHDKLGVPRAHLYSTMHAAVATGARGATAPVAIPIPQASAPVVHPIPPRPDDGEDLSEKRLRRVRAETEQVSVLLAEIFAEEEQPGAVAEPERAGEFHGLDVAHTGFLRRLLTRPAWPRVELDAAAREAGLMTDGAIETINEWAFDRYDAPFLEDGDPLTVNMTLLDAGRARAAAD